MDPVDPELEQLCSEWSVRNRVMTLGQLVARRDGPDGTLAADTDLAVDRLPGTGVLIRPIGKRASPGVVIYFHGGGYVLGSPRAVDPAVLIFAGRYGIPVLSVDYRLAPEHPYPAALDDGAAALELLDSGALDDHGVEPGPTILCGSSAGAGLALGVALRRRDEGLPATTAMALFSAMLDDRTSIGADDLQTVPWNHTSNRLAWQAFLGESPDMSEIPTYAAPARADSYAGLPPTYVDIGTTDIFLAENEVLARRMRLDGVEVSFRRWPGGYHGFVSTAPESMLARRCIATRLAFLEGIQQSS